MTSGGGRREVVILGGRGGGEIAGDVLQAIRAAGGALFLRGYLNDDLEIGHPLLGGPVLGEFDGWKDLPGDPLFCAPLHKAGDMASRAERIAGLGIPPERWATLVDPRAAVAQNAELAPGVVVAAGGVVMAGARLGAHVAVRQGAVVGHDSIVDAYAFLGIQSTICGFTRIAEGAHVAPGAVVRDGVCIGRYAVVGLGSVVLSDIADGTVVAGNPARPIASSAES